MFTIWDVASRPAQYDVQQVGPVRRTTQAEAWHENLREPGAGGSERTDVRGEGRRGGRVDPYRKAVERDSRPARRPVRTASDLMTAPVVFLTPEDTVAIAWALIRERRFRHVPILAASSDSAAPRLVGIVSDRDLLRVAGTPEHSPSDDVRDRPLRMLMRSPVFSAHPDTPIREIARVMFHEHIGSMPICDVDGNLVGILTRSDILRALLAEGPLKLWI